MIEQQSEAELEADARAEAKEMLRRQRISESLLLRKVYGSLTLEQHPHLGPVFRGPMGTGLTFSVSVVESYLARRLAKAPKPRKAKAEKKPKAAK